MIFPVTFSHQMSPHEGPGLVFVSLPLAFSQMAAGRLLSIVFFGLLVFAALTSAISLLEVLVSSLIDVRGWSRRGATLFTGLVAFALGVPSALHQGPIFGAMVKRWLRTDFLELMNAITANRMLPLGGLLIAVYVGWGMKPTLRTDEFVRLTPPRLHAPWLWMVRLASPLAVALVMMKTTGLMEALGL
jgi:NSS family neurotransmitter:Na+ symporter